jgi:hypothetical protein
VTYDDSFEYQEVAGENGTPRSEVHRPFARLRRDLLRAGLAVESVLQTETVDLNRFEPASDCLILILRPIPLQQLRTSLIIKTCAMEGKTIEAQVEHLVGQLEGPQAFQERILAVDSRKDSFLRQYAAGDVADHEGAIARLLRRGFIDRIVRCPQDPALIASLYSRWFGVEATDTHARNGAQLAPTVAALEACSGDLLLHVDADVMVCRRDRSQDYLAEMTVVLLADPKAVTVSLNIAQAGPEPYSAGGPAGPWRVESRAGLIHRNRLLSARPLPNRRVGEALELPWHRSLDLAVREGRMRSYRGGDCEAYFIHPPNRRKQPAAEWMMVLDRVEKGRVPTLQNGHVDLVGTLDDWFPGERRERFVFIVSGRNVAPGRFRRCFDSMLRQRRRDWGAVVIDDASANNTAEYVESICSAYGDRVTLVRPRIRRGLLANITLAIRRLCPDPSTVVITLDADDALLGEGVLDRIAAAYDAGADVTVGSMLRTDKHAEYPVDFREPRRRRGGNVWQHLRTFRKGLFDAVPDDELRLDGEYIDLATDWAFMLPIIERAENPHWIREPLYLYEPSGVGKGADRERRERVIARIVAKREGRPFEDASPPPRTALHGRFGEGSAA